MLTICLLASSGPVRAQAVSTAGFERDTRAASYWRLGYDNDFFTATDRYFTQGITFEVVSPRLAAFPLMRLFPAPSGATTRNGIAYVDDGYTASDLKAPQVLPGDHPYAGTKQLRAFALALDTVRRRRLTASLTVGIIGPAAAGAEIQTFIHRHTGNTIPQGWRNQIRNDVILNYDLGIERELLRPLTGVLLSGSASARAGTYNTAGTLGATLLVGRPGLPFRTHRETGRSVYMYVKPQLNAVVHDATLQGGLFNRSSPYVITSGRLSRLVFRQQIGFLYRSGARYIEYYQSMASPEFRGARAHRSGGFQIGVNRAG